MLVDALRQIAEHSFKNDFEKELNWYKETCKEDCRVEANRGFRSTKIEICRELLHEDVIEAFEDWMKNEGLLVKRTAGYDISCKYVAYLVRW